MIPALPGAQDQEAMRNRQAWLQALYKYEGRQDPSHPMHGLYTGLFAAHRSLTSTD